MHQQLEALLSHAILSIPDAIEANEQDAPKLVMMALVAYARRRHCKQTLLFPASGCPRVSISELPASPELALALSERIIGTDKRHWQRSEGTEDYCGAQELLRSCANGERRKEIIESLDDLGLFNTSRSALAGEAWVAYVRELVSAGRAPSVLTSSEIRTVLQERGWPVNALRIATPC